jgi:outer membrane protein assembly factor BamB
LDLGLGWSAPIVSGGRIYVTGDHGDELVIRCYSTAGELLWQTPNGRSWKANFPGARASCTLSRGELFHLNAHGRLACLDAGDGEVKWVVDTVSLARADLNIWGLSESVVVHGDLVFATPGGRDGFMVALDRATGRTVWQSPPLPDPESERVGYASPILVRYGGRLLLVTVSERAVVGVDARDGALLWHVDKPTEHRANCATVVFWKDHLFHTNPSGGGGIMLRLVQSEDGVPGVETAWECAADNISGGAVIVDDLVYTNGQKNSGWVCMDAATGVVHYDSRELVQGALIAADGRLYCLSERGTMALVRLGRHGFDPVSRFQLKPDRKPDAWTHPVICDGTLYLRYHDRLYGYDIRRHPDGD